MSTSTINLLRRTALALSAVAAFSISAPSQAAVITLTGVSGNTCSYSSMSVDPSGGFSVACSVSTPQPGAPGSLSLSQPATVTTGTPVSVTAFRTGGTTGAASANYNVSGAGCSVGSGALTWADGDGNGKTISVTTNNTGTAAASCTVALNSITGAAAGSPVSVSFNVNPAVSTPTPSPSCPAGFTAPANLLTAQLGGPGNILLQMQASNQVVAIPLPDTQPGYVSGQVAFSESAGGAFTPQPVTVNISISKCAGFIDTDFTNRCNIQSTNGTYNGITWFAQAYSIITGPNPANLRGYCWAPKSEGPWYINARWTYSQCAFGAQTCGFAVNQNYGPY